MVGSASGVVCTKERVDEDVVKAGCLMTLGGPIRVCRAASRRAPAHQPLRRLGGRVLRRALRHHRARRGDERAVLELAVDDDVAAGLEEVGNAARVDHRDRLARRILDVAQHEAQAAARAGLRSACRRPGRRATTFPGLRRELARLERRRSATCDRGVEEEDCEHRRDREGDDEPRRRPLPGHS